MLGEEVAGAAVGKVRGILVAALAELGGEAVVEAVVVVERDPGVVKPVGDDAEFVGVIMPMRI